MVPPQDKDDPYPFGNKEQYPMAIKRICQAYNPQMIREESNWLHGLHAYTGPSQRTSPTSSQDKNPDRMQQKLFDTLKVIRDKDSTHVNPFYPEDRHSEDGPL